MFGASAVNGKRREEECKLLEELVHWAAKKNVPLDGVEGVHKLSKLIDEPPFTSIGGMAIEDFLPVKRKTDLRRKLANEGRKNAATMASATRMAEETLAVYRKLQMR